MITLKYIDPSPLSELSLPISKRFSPKKGDLFYMPNHDGMQTYFQKPEKFVVTDYPKREFNADEYKKWKKENMPLIFASTFYSVIGFGYQAIEYLKSLSKICDVYAINKVVVTYKWKEEFLKIMEKESKEIPLVTLYDYTPTVDSSVFLSKFKGIYTMFEATLLPDFCVPIINSYDFVIAPTSFSKKCFEDSGVTKPIYIVPHGTDPNTFTYKKREKGENFIFGTYGFLTYRKGVDIAVDAFRKAFPLEKYPNVHLHIKTVNPSLIKSWNNYEDPRIWETYEKYSRESLVKMLHEWNCLIFPTRGEGFGLPPIEAMSSGLPVICTNFSGCTDYLNDKTGYPINYTLRPTLGYGQITKKNENGVEYLVDDPEKNRGFMAEPDLDHTASLMREVYENYDKALEKGKYASDMVRKDYRWDKMGRKMLKSIDEFLKSQIKDGSS